MAEPGALERGHVKVKLIKLIAAGELSVAELATRHGVSRQAIAQFTRRHAERIAEVAAKLDDEFAGLWVAEKANRIATYQQQIEDIASILEATPAEGGEDARAERGAGVNVSTAELLSAQARALRAVADELGQIPARVQVAHSGSLDVRINGVDLGALT